ncbi:hypothetical protein CXQ85_001908 [Candidozyma haemuli]|uniref:Zn(2)-C6 fungal-type domain-containing protein n=1 Tax=Candidozyma haemuli TaxID=45357 RepID=A0A2V1AQK3_9ASCO|nr:hypothetical protein CXQ85_001908 [[Candida] haemuloni]PVH20128.1 hypothetical protein CXQ85_001908 [[Candida] haemuloni]
MKCDEQLPVCQNCLTSKRKCIRGVRLNFTSYTFYDPKESMPDPVESGPEAQAPVDLYSAPRYFAFLDQSVAVSTYYKDGKDAYRPYLHLHSQHDLMEASRQMNVDCNSSKAVSTLDPSENVISENYDITNLLANPELQGKPSDFTLDYHSARSSFSHHEQRRSSVELLNELPAESSVDAQLFTELIHTYRYYWLLDIFNEIHWWKVLVPNYCVRLAQAAEVEGKTPPGSSFLLINCLLVCADTASLEDILRVTENQSNEWEFFETREVNMSTFRAFERVLLSVTLVTLALFIQLTLRQTLVLDKNFQLILANQGKLFQKLMLRLTQVPAGRMKKLKQSPLTVESVKAMTILRFMIKVNIQRRNAAFSYSLVPTDPESISQTVIDYSPTQAIDWSYFFTITPYETELLNNGFANFDMPQVAPYSLRSQPGGSSDAKKLRDSFWEIIKADYVYDNVELRGLFSTNEPALQTLRETDVNTGNQPRSSFVRSNERSLAMNFLSQHLNRVQQFSSNDSVAGCANLFRLIDDSSMEKPIKAQWHRHFSWVFE